MTIYNIEDENIELIKRLRQGASICRDRGLNLDFAIVADMAATEIEALTSDLKHWKTQATSLATAVMMDETANDSNPCVSLQIADDGVWAHFRVGSGFAYSQNLSADEMSKKFADEYIKHRSF